MSEPSDIKLCRRCFVRRAQWECYHCHEKLYCDYNCSVFEYHSVHQPYCPGRGRDNQAHHRRRVPDSNDGSLLSSSSSSNSEQAGVEAPAIEQRSAHERAMDQNEKLLETPHGQVIKAVLRIASLPNEQLRASNEFRVGLPGERALLSADRMTGKDIDAQFSNLRSAFGESLDSSKTRLLLLSIPEYYDVAQVHIGTRVDMVYKYGVRGHRWEVERKNAASIVGFIGETHADDKPHARLGARQLFSGTVSVAMDPDRCRLARRGQHRQSSDRLCTCYWLFINDTFYHPEAVDESSNDGACERPAVFEVQSSPARRAEVLHRITLRFLERHGRRTRSSSALLAPEGEDIEGEEDSNTQVCVVCQTNEANVYTSPCAHPPIMCIGCTNHCRRVAEEQAVDFTCGMCRTPIRRTKILHGTMQIPEAVAPRKRSVIRHASPFVANAIDSDDDAATSDG